MANDPEDKQPPATPPTSPAGPEAAEEEFPPDLEWQLRAHPVIPRKAAPPPTPAPPPKTEAPAAASPSKPAAVPPKPVEAPPPLAAAPAGERATPVAPEPQKPTVAPPAEAPKPPAAQPPKPPTAPAPGAPASAAPPRPAPPPPPPKEGPAPLENELVKRFKQRFGEAIREAWLDRKQAILVVERERLGEIARYARDDEKFDFLTDLTAVDWPKRQKRFDLVLNLYSFAKNERLRLKAQLRENEPAASVASVWPAANWLEREAYDMFGIVFEGHPGLKRILLPEEWQGHPLRKDYDILTQDTAWVRENLGIESGQ